MTSSARLIRKNSREIELVDVQDPAMPMVRRIFADIQGSPLSVQIDFEMDLTAPVLLVVEDGQAELREHSWSTRVEKMTPRPWRGRDVQTATDLELVEDVLRATLECMGETYSPASSARPASKDGRIQCLRALHHIFEILDLPSLTWGAFKGMRFNAYGARAIVMVASGPYEVRTWASFEASRIMTEAMQELGFETGRNVEIVRGGFARSVEAPTPGGYGTGSSMEELEALALAHDTLQRRPDLTTDAAALVSWFDERKADAVREAEAVLAEIEKTA